MSIADSSNSLPDEWIALVSGLEVGAANPADGQIQMLAEYLAGDAGGLEDQSQAARISRLIIAGNALGSISGSALNGEPERKPVRIVHDQLFPHVFKRICTPHQTSRKQGQQASFHTNPTHHLALHLTDVARSMPVHLLPGPEDPAATILPQQPLPRAMFGEASRYATFACESNPTFISVAPGRDPVPSSSRATQPSASTSKSKTNGAASSDEPKVSRTFLVHSGQPVDDMYKYVPTPPITRMALTEATLRWRHIAPTAPDTLWCHPYFAKDPFVMAQTPDVYVVGNQPAFATKLVEERSDSGDDVSDRTPKRCRIVLLPKFRESGTLVLVNMRTLAVRKVQFAVEGMNAGGGES